MHQYLRAEIDGDAAHSAALISELRQQDFSLFIDRDGFLLVPEAEWKEMELMAERFECQLYSLAAAQQAA
jgi:hypothetical protein